ncbi:NAD(P)-binding protein [Dissoconium aciculare CBS 342.82]|uniref:NAD(P)-binding protein n=1 Tax=Dissoconium aciculare CBS 342.82 TaxID=1314786 RepID=A0A6J3LU56_9PEZI|nr:NAD(P)-binding protein [Dissoconium aciculare CBS 342.82]KAF1818152.1 NAD(P)-binding protein [Dissoconium aciculare CBS 342.82]
MAENPGYPSPTKGWHNKAQPSADPSNPALSAKGKSVLVTGGGNTGIGGETARWFARAGAARIGLLGRREGPLLENKALIEKINPDVEVFIQSTDVTDEKAVESAFAAFAGQGKIDTLIHAAAVIGPKENVLQADPKEYFDGIRLNLEGGFWVARSFVRHAAPDAHVVAINSWGAHLSLNDAFASYCVAKLAVYRLWDTVLLAAPNLSIFHIQPGVVLTEMNLSVGGAASFKDIKTDDVTLPASFCLWLASPEARFLSGKFLWANWDIDELKARAEELKSGDELNITVNGWPFKSGM